jgi:pilus assembly protein CpaF
VTAAAEAVSPGSSAAGDDRAIKAVVHRGLLDELTPAGSLDRAELRTRIRRLLARAAPVLSEARACGLVEELVREVDGLGPVEPLLADEDVTEIMLNGGHTAYVERAGRLEAVDVGLDAAGVQRIAERVIAPLGLRLDRASPMVDARLPDGSRLHAVIPPLAPDGPVVTIRRFTTRRLDLCDFGIEGEAAEACTRMVRGGWNLVVAGATSAGKTTLLNTLARGIDPTERIVTIEETTELRLDLPHVVRLEARPPNAEGVGAVTVRQLVRGALRMRPDRIVVGEVRGAEALDMLQALNTGHDGSLTTVHANSAVDALARLETLALFAGSGLPLAAVRAQLAAAVDAVVFVARDSGGARRVEAIAEVERFAGEHPTRVRALFQRDGGVLVERAAPSRPLRRGGCQPRRPPSC